MHAHCTPNGQEPISSYQSWFVEFTRFWQALQCTTTNCKPHRREDHSFALGQYYKIDVYR